MTTPSQAESTRLLLALDAAGIAAEVVERAVAVAVGLDAELAGLFVEDETLARAAALPFAVEVHAQGAERAWGPGALAAANRLAAREAMRLLEAFAAARRVRWSFATAAGARLAAALAADERADLLLPPRRRTLRAGQAPGGGAFQRVSVLHDASPQTGRALQVARALAINGHTRELLVFSAQELTPRVLAALGGPGLRVYYQHAAAGDPASLVRAMGSATGTGLSVLPRELVLAADGETRRLLEALPGALLLLR